jgi:hypothetical protein
LKKLISLTEWDYKENGNNNYFQKKIWYYRYYRVGNLTKYDWGGNSHCLPSSMVSEILLPSKVYGGSKKPRHFSGRVQMHKHISSYLNCK